MTEVISTIRFDEDSDLGRMAITRASKIKAEERFQYQNKGVQEENYWMK